MACPKCGYIATPTAISEGSGGSGGVVGALIPPSPPKYPPRWSPTTDPYWMNRKRKWDYDDPSDEEGSDSGGLGGGLPQKRMVLPPPADPLPSFETESYPEFDHPFPMTGETWEAAQASAARQMRELGFTDSDDPLSDEESVRSNLYYDVAYSFMLEWPQICDCCGLCFVIVVVSDM